MKPLLITDCDEVLLHMVRHFGAWLDEHHDIDFTPNGGDFATSMRRRACGSQPQPEEIFDLVYGFFPAEMGRQTLVPHARESLESLSAHADIVVLTNLTEDCRVHRIDQLAAHGIEHRVVCNQGGKGRPVAQLIEEFRPSAAVFIDDLSYQHESVAKHAPDVLRLHMVSEPSLAPSVPAAPHAHVRIDDWRDAHDWIAQRFGLTLAAAAGSGGA